MDDESLMHGVNPPKHIHMIFQCRVYPVQGHGQQAQSLLFALGTAANQRLAHLPPETTQLFWVDGADAPER